MQVLEQPHELVAPPPPPPPATSHANIIEQVKYLPPVVADSVMIEDTIQQMPAAEDVQQRVEIATVIEVRETNEEVQEEKTEQTPFFKVQEMPEPQGGESGLYKFISKNTRLSGDSQGKQYSGNSLCQILCFSQRNS